MKKLISPGVVLIVSRPARIAGPPFHSSRPFTKTSFFLMIESGVAIGWDVTLADGNGWRYGYFPIEQAVGLAPTIQALDKETGHNVGGLNGGELLNFSVRSHCLFKRKL
jgi:hypothetical protein